MLTKVAKSNTFEEMLLILSTLFIKSINKKTKSGRKKYKIFLSNLKKNPRSGEIEIKYNIPINFDIENTPPIFKDSKFKAKK
tara:strand:+ start:426 stop:671 length:246 start_codon:yes stop_codon:yes gene_type:complete